MWAAGEADWECESMGTRGSDEEGRATQRAEYQWTVASQDRHGVTEKWKEWQHISSHYSHQDPCVIDNLPARPLTADH